MHSDMPRLTVQLQLLNSELFWAPSLGQIRKTFEGSPNHGQSRQAPLGVMYRSMMGC